MKKLFLFMLLSLMVSSAAWSDSSKPPVSQPMVREGDLAIKLAGSYNLGSNANETEAESALGNIGIAPRNGWIADYPVTPDVADELRQSIMDASDANRLSFNKDGSVKIFQDTMSSFNLGIVGSTPTQTPNQGQKSNVPSTTVINNYYSTQGPPVVTYYEPPVDYTYLYVWVPHPFWWWGFSYPGYYVLRDFHKVVVIHNRVEVVSNHFVDHSVNRVVRIDPVGRFNGYTHGGIGVPRYSKKYIYREYHKGDERIFRGAHERAMEKEKKGGEGRRR